MRGELQVHEAVSRLVLHGELDLVTVNRLRALLTTACESGNHIIVDISDTAFIDVLSLSAILAAADLVRDRGGAFSVVGATAAVRRICALLNAEDVLAPQIPRPRISLH